MARFIGKASKYNVDDERIREQKLINAKGDEFIILKESISHVGFLQESILLSDGEKGRQQRGLKTSYIIAFSNGLKKIEVGNELKKP